jgi:hypothetical protein
LLASFFAVSLAFAEPIPFESSYVPVSDFERRWAPHAKRWGIDMDTLKSLFATNEFILVPFVRSRNDFDNYFAIRNNTGGSMEHIKFFMDGTRKPENECRAMFELRCGKMNSDLSLSLFVIPVGSTRCDWENYGWIAVGGLNGSKNLAAEIAYMRFGKRRHRQGMMSRACTKVIAAVSELRTRGIYSANSLYATVHPDNASGIKLLLKSGFTTDDSPPVETPFGPRKTYTRQIITSGSD